VAIPRTGRHLRQAHAPTPQARSLPFRRGVEANHQQLQLLKQSPTALRLTYRVGNDVLLL
jgi:hypothetical protein